LCIFWKADADYIEKAEKNPAFAKKSSKVRVKDLIFLSNYIKMEYGEKRNVFFSRPKTTEEVGREAFCG